MGPKGLQELVLGTSTPASPEPATVALAVPTGGHRAARRRASSQSAWLAIEHEIDQQQIAYAHWGRLVALQTGFASFLASSCPAGGRCQFFEKLVRWRFTNTVTLQLQVATLTQRFQRRPYFSCICSCNKNLYWCMSACLNNNCFWFLEE